MAIDSDIRDQAYQYFILEAPDLLQVIETELLTLTQERSTAKVHNMMRAAHSLKGGAASVGLETIKTLAHSLEDIFNALFHEELEIDTEIESLLLQAYDCLRLPVMEQINHGQFNGEQAMAEAEPVFAQLEARLGDFIGGTAIMPSSIELGVDIALSIFEVDVAEGLDRLADVLAAPQGKEVSGELQAQAEVFAGLAELLNLPGFGAIATTALAALSAHPQQALEITQLAFTDFQAGRVAVIAGDRTSGGAPSTALTKLATPADAESGVVPFEVDELFNSEQLIVADADSVFSLDQIDESLLSEQLIVADADSVFSSDDVFSDFTLTAEPAALDSSPLIPVSEQDSFLQELDLEIEMAQDDDTELIQQIFDVELVDQVSLSAIADQESTIPTLDNVFGDFALTAEPALDSSPSIPVIHPTAPPQVREVVKANTQDSRESVRSAAIVPAARKPAVPEKVDVVPAAASSPQLSVRVDLERLEAMNNLVGELSINRNSLSLQNQQLQDTVQDLLRRFAKFQQMGNQLRTLSDHMLVSPERSSRMPSLNGHKGSSATKNVDLTLGRGAFGTGADFDSLEMDSYGELHSLLQTTLEDIVQIEEAVGDVVLLAGQSNQILEGQRQMVGHLRDDLMWVRMLPLGEVLNRFPRMMRDLSTAYEKPIEFKLSGTGVLVDKAALEKLNDPLLHLLRNAFDHGIELPSARQLQGKSERGLIEVKAYHQGSQTVIEIRDDGQGINLERIKSRALAMGLLSESQLATTSTSRLLELLFEPGFSTAAQVSELSGRGVGLDVVRSQLRSLKGNVTVSFEPGQGTTFTLRIPLTLTITKLLVCLVGSTAFALPSDSIEELLIPEPGQIKQSGRQRFLHWQERIIPAYKLSDLLKYACPVPEAVQSLALVTAPSPEDWAPPMLLLAQDEQIIALEIDRLITEQELVIKPFGSVLAPPSYIYGCTILNDGSLIPVIDGAALLKSLMGQTKMGFSSTLFETSASLQAEHSPSSLPLLPIQTTKAPTILVIDDSITVRQTLVLTFEKAGYRVLQARDGREGIEQLDQSTVQLVVCDIEMPNMNGFEFLSHRRTDPLISKIPTVMLTSRSSDKHRQLAKHLGANGYFTKPFIEQEFLSELKTIIDQDASVKVPALTH